MKNESVAHDIVLVASAGLLAALLVTVRAPFWPLYPAAMCCGALACAYGGRIVQFSLLVAASAFGPFVWHLAGARGAAQTAVVLQDAGLTGLVEYSREFVLVGMPRRAWLLLPCAVLFGIVPTALAARYFARAGWKISPRLRRLAIAAIAGLAFVGIFGTTLLGMCDPPLP